MSENLKLVAVDELAQAAGIRRALREYAENPFVYCVPEYQGTVKRRATGGLYVVLKESVVDDSSSMENYCWSGGGDEPAYRSDEFGCYFYAEDTYPADRGDGYDYCGGNAEYADYPRARYTFEPLRISDFDTPKERKSIIAALFDQVDEGEVDHAESVLAYVAEDVFDDIAARLDWEETRERRRMGLEPREVEEAWPKISKALLIFGPMSTRQLESMPGPRIRKLDSILRVLLKDKLLVETATYYSYWRPEKFDLSDKGLSKLEISERPDPLSPEEQLEYLLGMLGPSKVSDLDGAMGRSSSYVRAKLRALVAEGRAVEERAEGRRSYTYRLPGQTAKLTVIPGGQGQTSTDFADEIAF